MVEQTAGQLAQQGLDVRKLFTPDLVRSLLDTSRPEAEERLQARLALEALAAAEAIAVEASAIEARVREVSRQLNNTGNRPDPQRLRDAVEEELLREALLTWLEANSTIRDKVASAQDDAAPAAAAAATGSQGKASAKTAAADASAGASAASTSAEPVAAAAAPTQAAKPARRGAKADVDEAEDGDVENDNPKA